MRNFNSLHVLTITLAGVAAGNRFINTALAQAGDGDNTYGVSRTSGADGEAIAVDVLGTAIVETGGPILAGARVQSDASGRAITIGSGAAVARLAPGESATASGQFVEVILLTN